MDYYEDDEKFGDYFDDQPDSGEGYFSGGDDYKYDSEPDWFQDLREEFEAKERVGGTIGCWSIGKDGRPLKVQTPLGRFCLHVDAVARHLKGKWQGMKEADIEQLKKRIKAFQKKRQHANCQNILDFFQNEKAFFVVSDYCREGNLHSELLARYNE